MTSEQLISEGRRLQRPCVFLRPQGSGPVAAIWHERDDDEIESTGHHCWLTVDARHVPGLPPSVTGYISVFTDDEKCEGGRVDVTPAWPKRAGTELYTHPASVLPPLEAVFARGSDAIDVWLASRNLKRTTPFLSSQQDAATAGYQEVWNRESPLAEDVYAVLGGWHMPWPEDDWNDLIDEQLMVFTVRDSEPWVEAWRTRVGQFRVIQRVT